MIFTNGQTPPSLIVATYLSRRGTQILVVDPPPDEEYPKYLERPEQARQRERRIKNDIEFRRATRLISEAKVLSFAGADQAAASKIEKVHTRILEMPKSAFREPEIRENEFGTFKGIQQRVGLKDRFTVDLFQALDTNVLDTLLSDEPAHTYEQMQIFQKRSATVSAKAEGTQPVIAIHEKGALVVRTAGPDGSLLEIRVSPP